VGDAGIDHARVVLYCTIPVWASAASHARTLSLTLDPAARPPLTLTSRHLNTTGSATAHSAMVTAWNQMRGPLGRFTWAAPSRCICRDWSHGTGGGRGGLWCGLSNCRSEVCRCCCFAVCREYQLQPEPPPYCQGRPSTRIPPPTSPKRAHSPLPPPTPAPASGAAPAG